MGAVALSCLAQTLDARQIASALGLSERHVQRRAEQQGWRYLTVATLGGQKRMYDQAGLPEDVQDALRVAEARNELRQLQKLYAVTRPLPQTSGTDLALAPGGQLPVAAAAASPALVMSGQVRRVVTDMKSLSTKERKVAEATLQLCVAVDEQKLQHGLESATKACDALALHLHSGDCSPTLVEAARITYLRPRKSADDVLGIGDPIALSVRLRRYYGFYMAGLREGDASRYLVPAPTPKKGEKFKREDRLAFLAHFCKPSRPNVMQAWKASEAWYEAHGFNRPAVDTFYRLDKLLPVTVKYRGRFTGSAWRALVAHRSRDVSMFKSNDIWVGDGHTFKARVQSPITGKAFRPEVTLVMDWRSRKIVGWSVDLAESTLAVSAAFRDAQLRTRARPLVYYRDNGSGQTGKLIDDDVHGTLARQGIASETGIPGNPQGRGVMERIWQTVLIPFAAQYPTFMGRQADPETVRKAQIQVVKDQNAGRVSHLLPSWKTFMSDLQAHIDAYNTGHQHSALGGMTPEAAYQQNLDPDSLVFGPDDSEIHALWMPEVLRTPRRGLIELFGNKYFLPTLLDDVPEGESVRVRFDVHRAEEVLVLDMDGRQLGAATWEGHRSAAFPVPYIEAKREERVQRFIKKADAEVATKREELTQTIDAQPLLEVPVLPPRRRAEAQPVGSLIDTMLALKQEQKSQQERRAQEAAEQAAAPSSSGEKKEAEE